MSTISRSGVIGASSTYVWRAIHDPDFVALCVPGASLLEREGDCSYKAAIEVRFGPKTLTFVGGTTYEFDEATRSCTVEALGTDRRMQAQLSVRADVTVAELTPFASEACLVAVSVDVQATGAIAGFLETGGTKVGQQLLQAFMTRLNEECAHLESAAVSRPSAQDHDGLDGLAIFRATLRELIRKLWNARPFRRSEV